MELGIGDFGTVGAFLAVLYFTLKILDRMLTALVAKLRNGSDDNGACPLDHNPEIVKEIRSIRSYMEKTAGQKDTLVACTREVLEILREIQKELAYAKGARDASSSRMVGS